MSTIVKAVRNGFEIELQHLDRGDPRAQTWVAIIIRDTTRPDEESFCYEFPYLNRTFPYEVVKVQAKGVPAWEALSEWELEDLEAINTMISLAMEHAEDDLSEEHAEDYPGMPLSNAIFRHFRERGIAAHKALGEFANIELPYLDREQDLEEAIARHKEWLREARGEEAVLEEYPADEDEEEDEDEEDEEEDEDEGRKERARELGMGLGVAAYNDHMGYGQKGDEDDW